MNKNIESFVDFMQTKFSDSINKKWNDYLPDMLAQAGIGTWEWDLCTGNVSWSKNIPGFLGFPPEKTKVRRNECISNVHQDDLGYLQVEIEKCLNGDGALKVEYRVVWPDNSIHWVQSRGHVVLSDDDKPAHMIGVMFDITPRKQMESELREARNLAIIQNKAKSDFLSKMSHEIRTPLNAVIGFSQLHEHDENITSEQKQSIECIKNAGEHINGLVDDILDLAAIEAGKVDLNIEPVDLKRILTECVDLFSVTARKHEQTLGLDIDDFTAQYLNVDQRRFIQIILNLLSNAAKYNKPSGNIYVSCRGDKNTTIISIRDEGLGLDAEQQSKLFQPFQRLGAEKTGIQGTGMGLVITRQLVELMHGRISVESKPGGGSEFRLEFPVIQIDV